MKKLLLVLPAWIVFSCSNNQTKSETSKKAESGQVETGEDDKPKKEKIIQQLKANGGLQTSVTHDSVGTGGIRNGVVQIKNNLADVSFDIVNVQVNVLQDNGEVIQSTPFTFTDLQPGVVKTREIPGTGTRGKSVQVVINSVQSKWLTDGHLLTL